MLKETSLIVHSPLVVEYCYLGLGQDRELGHLRIKSGQRCDGNRTRSRHGSTAILLLIGFLIIEWLPWLHMQTS